MSERQWTPAQKQAITTRGGDLLVSAAAGSGKTAVLTENLRDMGLDDKSIAKCLQMVESGQYQALDCFLKSYRQTLLDSVHKYNDRIDCLDYFAYTLRQHRTKPD